jgi:peroxiredoxin
MELSSLNLLIYQDNVVQTKTIQDRRVLFCSVPRFVEPVTQEYIKHLSGQQDLLGRYNIRLVLVASAGGIITLARANTHFPDLTVVYDTNLQFTKSLATLQNKTTSIDWLSKFWTYQVLVTDNKIEQFYEQPTEDHLKHLLRSGAKDPQFISRLKLFWQDIDEHQVFSRMMLSKEENRIHNGQRIFFYNLWPNRHLEQYLVDSNINT